MKVFNNLASAKHIFFIFALSSLPGLALSDDAPGSPGLPHTWSPALKQAVGTAYSADSKVWFTVTEGILSEVFYPSIDSPQIGDLQFIVTDGKSFFSEQRKNVRSEVSYTPNSNEVIIKGTDRLGAYTLEQKIITDPSSSTIRIKVIFTWKKPGLRLFVLLKPALNNGVKQNIAEARDGYLLAQNEAFLRTIRPPRNRRYFTGSDLPVSVALMSSIPFSKTSTGYVGFSDGWQELSKNFELKTVYQKSGPGNIALTGEIPVAVNANTTTVDLSLAFSTSTNSAINTAKTSLDIEFSKLEDRFNQGWKTYLQGLRSDLDDREKRSVMTIKTHEDKERQGAIIASMGKPGAPESDRATDANIGGYHLIWPRDLYYAAMGLLAAGDIQTPTKVLKYLAETQKSDGSWNQNFWVDGNQYWKGIQMDQVGFPILLAQQLLNRKIFSIDQFELNMIRKAAGFLVKNGPSTQQDRWEEVSGFVPSTLSVEIAALRSAGALLNDETIKSTAKAWEQQLDAWIKVDTGLLGQNYYLRSSPTGNPNTNETINLANGAGQALASSIIDGGFLSLVWLGIRSFNNPTILNSLKILESAQLSIAQFLPNGASIYRRYNKDNYGPNREGGFWPLLAAERGKYAVISGDFNKAQIQSDLIEKASLTSGMIPEQLIQLVPQSQVGHGVACPLVWAHAEHILLKRSIKDRKIFDSL